MYSDTDTILGEGAFGKVIKVIDAQGKEYAKKMCTRTKEKYHLNTKYEKEFMELLRHNPSHEGYVHVVHLVDAEQHGTGWHLIMDLYEGDLLSLMKAEYITVDGELVKRGLSEETVCDIALHVSAGLAYMNHLGYAHCDLKPENVLWKRSTTSQSGYHFSVSDFGNAMKLMKTYYPLQTPRYRSPENILASTSIRSCDMPSLGCILYQAITGEYVSNTSDSMEHLESMLDAVGYDLIQQYDMSELPEIQAYMDKVFFGIGLMNYSFSDLQTSMRKLKYKKATDLSHLMSMMLLPFPTQRIQANQVHDHSLFHDTIEYEHGTECNTTGMVMEQIY